METKTLSAPTGQPPEKPTGATSALTHGSLSWRHHQRDAYLGHWWFSVGTRFARALPLALRACASLTARELEALPVGRVQRIDLSEGKGKIGVLKLSEGAARKYSNERDFSGEMLAIFTPNANGVLDEKLSEARVDNDAIVMSLEGHELLHQMKDPYKGSEQLVAAALGFCAMADRDRIELEDHSRAVLEAEGGIKRLMFAIDRDWRSRAMRERWEHVRETLTHVFFRRERVIARIDSDQIDPILEGTGQSYELRELGPFAAGELELWRVSRHILEDASLVDEMSLSHKLRQKKARKRGEEQKPRGKHSSKHSIGVSIQVFKGSTFEICGWLATHTHKGLNADSKDLQLDIMEIVSGRALTHSGKKSRPSRRRARAARTITRSIELGIFTRRTNPDREDELLPILRRSGRKYVIAFQAPKHPMTA